MSTVHATSTGVGAGDHLLARCVRARRVTPRSDLRSGVHADIQLVAGAGPYELDVLVRVLEPGRYELVGQVTTTERAYEPVRRLPLVLYDADAMRVMARTETDAFGEFTIRELDTADCVLALGDRREAPCVLIWEGGRRGAKREAAV